ncbi:MAG: hypothetical protein HKN87_19505 [Saprospiraceae bacterium]|nr:hypothetical protein [Saprospiraceae bacterium]
MEKPQLNNPNELQLDDAYRSLPNHGMIEILVDRAELFKTMQNLETIGYVGMEIKSDLRGKPRSIINAYKGKHGPCFETGRKASYMGAALAAMDDDNHLLISGVVKLICEKTAMLYQLPPYDHVITVSSPTYPINTRPFQKPVHFQDNRFEEDQEILFGLITEYSNLKERSLLFYPGPFRLLILADGTVVKRGEVNNVPLTETRQLIKMDRLQKAINTAPVKPVYFQDLYASQGSTCLISDLKPSAKSTHATTTDFFSLNKIHPALQKRLAGVIEKKKDYFILTGSDPSDTFGCCPSEEVGAANQLVRTGVLSACANQVGPQECPLTIYAFKDEITVLANDLTFRMNEVFRDNVYGYLKQKTNYWPKRVIRWLLLSFVTLSLLFAYVRFATQADKQSLANLFDQIELTQDEQIVILLFHYQDRCPQCTRMEFYTAAVLEEDFHEAVDQDLIRLQLINMDHIDYQDLVDESGLFAATIFLLKYDQGELKQKKILKEAWSLYLDEKAFKKMLVQEVNEMLGEYE